MKQKIIHILTAVLSLLSLSSFSQIIEPVHWTFSLSNVSNDGKVILKMKATIDSPWHIYALEMPADGPLPTSFNFLSLKNAEPIGTVKSRSKTISKFEPAFNMQLIFYEKEATFTQVFKLIDKHADFSISGEAQQMSCNDMQCLPPSKTPFNVTGKGLPQSTAEKTDQKKNAERKQENNLEEKEQQPTAVETVSKDTLQSTAQNNNINTSDTGADKDLWAPLVTELNNWDKSQEKASDSLWGIFFAGLMGGFLAVLTPCVWPIIPMTVSFFLKKNENKQKVKTQALLYGLSIVLIYVSLGLFITMCFSANTLNALSTNAIFNIFLFLLLIIFACSFFGGFEIMLPASWSTALDKKADNTGGILGILLMAFTLVVVSFSCTGPIIGTLLVSVSTQGNILGPTLGMLGFAMALAIPFTLFAFFPDWLRNLPKSGGWLNVVKVLLGFFELAFSLKFLSVADQAYGWNLLSRPTFIAIWVTLFILAGIYLLGKIRLPHDSPVESISVPRFFGAIACISFGIYLVPGLFGAPLNVISAFTPPLSKNDNSIYTKPVSAQFYDFDKAMAAAKAGNKPVIIDFTGYGCVNCRKMESAVWSDPAVSKKINEDYILVSLFVDDRTPLPQPITVDENDKQIKIETQGEKWSYLQRHKFGANAQPFYILLSPEGKLLNHSFAFTENPSEFLQFLSEGQDNINK